MARGTVSDLLTFVAVAREKSFTRAAGKLGVSQSALSHTIRELETRMGVRLLARTTRSVSPTEAGERLLQAIGPRFARIEAELAAVADLGEKVAGTIRITTTDYPADTILRPRLAPLLREYPELKVEIIIEYGMTDIVAERFDVGVRWGDQVAKDMVAVRIAPDCRMAIVGSPGYLAMNPAPATPQDLIDHNCVTLRLASSGALYAWELKKDGCEIQVRIEGQATFNGVYQMLHAAVSGCGLAFVPEELALPYVEAGRLVRVMEAWCPVFPGFHVYYQSRRHSSRALSLIVDAVRHRG